jgi:hypothetical protein
MRAAGLFVAISSVQALAPTAKRRDIGAFLGGAALTTLAPPALADVKIDPNSVRTTKGGAKYVVVKEGACPLIDPSGALGSCYPVRKSTSASDASRSHFSAMTYVAALARSSGAEPASPRHRPDIMKMAWRSTRRFSTNAS